MTHNKRPLVTIGIPTYNRAGSFLEQVILSAVNQTYKNIEILVSDNCSTDHTEALLNRFSDPRIRYVKQPQNIGANNNFNFCIDNATGKYLLLLPDDDLIDFDLIETCMDAIKDNLNISVIFTGNRVIDENAKILWETPNKGGGLSTADFILSWFSHNISLYVCSTLFNTKRLQELGGFRSKWNLYQDAVASLTLAGQYGRVDVFDVKASFRLHSSNMGGELTKIKKWCEDCLYLLDILCNLAGDNKQQIREKGILFFARQNYRMVSKIESPIERFKVYRMINETFDHRFTPFQYIYYRDINPLKIKAIRIIKGIIHH